MNTSMTKQDEDNIESLRLRGFAVVVFNPHDLRDADPDLVTDRLIQVGWDVIDGLATYQREE